MADKYALGQVTDGNGITRPEEAFIGVNESDQGSDADIIITGPAAHRIAADIIRVMGHKADAEENLRRLNQTAIG
jgi:hypothetical protein